MKRSVVLGVLAFLACGRVVQPEAPRDSSAVATEASTNSDASDDSSITVTCDDSRSTFIQPQGDCITPGFRCSDGTTRYSRCSVPAQRCLCTIVGGASYECAATTGYTPNACENVRNCCWQ